jgi:hypothetical protein
LPQSAVGTPREEVVEVSFTSKHAARTVIVRLAAVLVILFIVNAAVFLPAPGGVPRREALVGIVLPSCVPGGGIGALIAPIRRHERSAHVWLVSSASSEPRLATATTSLYWRSTCNPCRPTRPWV